MTESLVERSDSRPGGPRIDIDPEAVERGLGQLVLTVVELVRQLLERQALRRVEAGSLTDEQIERLGLALMRLEERMERLKQEFGLEDRDLELTLGPLADLLREEARAPLVTERTTGSLGDG